MIKNFSIWTVIFFTSSVAIFSEDGIPTARQENARVYNMYREQGGGPIVPPGTDGLAYPASSLTNKPKVPIIVEREGPQSTENQKIKEKKVGVTFSSLARQIRTNSTPATPNKKFGSSFGEMSKLIKSNTKKGEEE